MLKIATMFIICAAWAVTARSQERFDPVAEAGGGVWLRQGWDPWCVLDAQALLSPAGHARLGVAHSPGAFGLGELSASAASVAFPLGAGGAGVAVTRFGYDLYSEHSGVIAFGGGTGPMRFGAGIRYTRISIRGYGSTGMAGLDFTVLVAPLQWMRCGLRLTDVNRPRIGSSGERARATVSMAIAVLISRGLDCSLQAERNVRGRFAVRAGLAVRTSARMIVRCGASEDFGRIHAGVELSGVPAGVGYSVSVDPLLGWSHVFALTFDVPG
ncbi:MAG TPA: hypothetical protein VJO14_01975 [Bacteroidota bacterium]|nr:hypothetical protein [Bacteroidota bacterium]